VLDSLSRPICRFGLVLLVISSSVLAGAMSAPTSMAREAMGGQPAGRIDIVQPELTHLGSNVPAFRAQPEDLTDRLWRLTSYSSDGFLTPALPDTPVTATFDNDGTVSGNASCNDYSGPYRSNDYTISIGPLTATRMACERDVMDQEQAFLEALESAGDYMVQASTLTLADEGGRPLAIFSRGLL